MKKICICLLLLWLMPQSVLATTLTKDILNELGFYDKSWQGFLKKPDTTTWQCGEIAGDVVQYRVNGDVIGYDEINHIWWHLYTPVSRTLPIEALALRTDKKGNVLSQVVTLQKTVCKSRVKSIVKKQVVVIPTAPVVVKKSQTKAIPEVGVEQVIVKKDVSVVTAKHKIVPAVQQKRKNTDTSSKISSTWDFMELYRQYVEGE